MFVQCFNVITHWTIVATLIVSMFYCLSSWGFHGHWTHECTLYNFHNFRQNISMFNCLNLIFKCFHVITHWTIVAILIVSMFDCLSNWGFHGNWAQECTLFDFSSFQAKYFTIQIWGKRTQLNAVL